MNVQLPGILKQLPTVTWPSWERNVVGDNFYDIQSIDDWAVKKKNLTVAQNHAILTPAILFIAKLFSQSEFEVIRKSTGKAVPSHKALDLLENPNPYQTQQDFLETVMFMMIAQGVCVVWKKTILGFKKPKALYVLDYDKIVWPPNFNKSKWKTNDKSIMETTIRYDIYGENILIKLKDLMFFYDLPNGMNRTPFEVKSRLDGLSQTLLNTTDSLTAKNIILKSNGKELITGKKESFPLTADEKKDLESMWENNFGLGFSRKRGVITKADLTWKSMHIALRDLGLDESVKIDGNLIYTALHIPKDILSLEAKKTTYNNFKESMVSYIQNEMQASLNSFVAVLNRFILDDNYKIKGSFEHLPIMQFILIERYKGIKGRGEALFSLRKSGLPDEVALELCGFERNLELNPLMQNQNNEQQGQESETQTQ